MNKAHLDIKAEIITSCIGIVVSIFIPKIGFSDDIAWFIGVLVVVIPVSFITLKIYLNKLVNYFVNEMSLNTGIVHSICHKISQMDDTKIGYARELLKDTSDKIDKIVNGIITLTEADYFDRIISESKKLNSDSKVIAVNIFDERRFEHDPRERLYFEENVKAVKYRNASIKRIFVIDDRQIKTEISKEKIRAIKKNKENGICIDIIFLSSLIGKNELLSDWTMFDGIKPRLYVDYQDKIDETRVSHGEIRLSDSDIEQFKRNFRILEEHAITKEQITFLFKEAEQ